MLEWIFPLGDSESRNIMDIVKIPCQVVTPKWDKRADSYTEKHITISAGSAASVQLCDHFWVFPYSCS